jgi:hypothetical protein
VIPPQLGHAGRMFVPERTNISTRSPQLLQPYSHIGISHLQGVTLTHQPVHCCACERFCTS